MWCIFSPPSFASEHLCALHKSVWKSKEGTFHLVLCSEHTSGSTKIDTIIPTQREIFPESLNQASVILYYILDSPISSSLVSISQLLDQNVSHTGSLAFSYSNKLIFISTFLSMRGARRWLSKSNSITLLNDFVIKERIP